MKTPFLLLIFCLIGCQASQTAVVGPQGPRPTEKNWITPTSVPLIDLTQENVSTKWVATPTIIDTATFPNQHQPVSAETGPYYRPATFLPAHKKPKTEDRGLPNSLRAGFGNSETFIQDVSGFEAIEQTPWTPPDPSIAVGPNHVLVTVNMAIAWYDKDGNEQFSARLDSTGDPGFLKRLVLVISRLTQSAFSTHMFNDSLCLRLSTMTMSLGLRWR